ncbi:hypothetical protein ABR738_01265 [Streptomyces sp. Edi4]|uniref:DUF6919 domain-containing protein n=1 Tax=Streptomyces sp. Edi4 TaxID=3162527 RepID=UPI0033063B11
MKLPWMSRSDKKQWKNAATFSAVAELMALWLEGKVGSWPGYQPRYGPDEETLPYTGVLAAANRAGYLTISSQPGFAGQGCDGKDWQQRAAVEGFIADRALLLALSVAAQEAGLEVRLHSLLNEWGNGAVTVTTRRGLPTTSFGRALTIGDLDFMWRGCAPEAVNAIAGSHYVTVVDPKFGPTTRLWEALEQVSTRPVPPPPADAPKVLCSCGCTALGWQICGDGCNGVVDQDDGRCQACIDPSVIIDWSKVCDGEENECANCGAPYFSSRKYCSTACEDAGAYDEDDLGGADAPVAPRPVGPASDPWASASASSSGSHDAPF